MLVSVQLGKSALKSMEIKAKGKVSFTRILLVYCHLQLRKTTNGGKGLRLEEIMQRFQLWMRYI